LVRISGIHSHVVGKPSLILGIIRSGYGRPGCAVVQRFAEPNQYNLVCRESQRKGVIDYCKKNGILFIAWRPIMLLYPGAPDPFYPLGTYKLLDEIAKKYNKTNVQIAVKWLLKQDGVSIVFKSSNKQHIDEILDVENFQLSDEDWERLNREFPVQLDKGCTADGYFELS
ncbi:MAG: aldo/keto reductase, partial [Candidatus Parvarchaeum sp.]|nr:aldo/keto reductase [Candidatus Parvarchaeum tengchongense]